MSDDTPRRTRRPTGWADIPAMDPPHQLYRETPALAAIAAILDRLSAVERRRVLAYLADRYTVIDAEIEPPQAMS